MIYERLYFIIVMLLIFSISYYLDACIIITFIFVIKSKSYRRKDDP